MRVLLDTCVISEIRHPKGNPGVKSTVESLAEEDIFISVITIGELTKGIHALSKSKRKSALKDWLSTLKQFYADRLLPIDLEVTSIWGEITAKAQKQGKQVSVADGLIAATALSHGLHLMTRNTTDFESTGALILNPWEN